MVPSDCAMFSCTQNDRDEVPAVLGGGGGQALPAPGVEPVLMAGGIFIIVAGDPPGGDQGVGIVEFSGLMEVGGGHYVALGGDDGTEGFVLHRLPTHKGDVVGRGVVLFVV